jgi:hypothetical protein
MENCNKQGQLVLMGIPAFSATGSGATTSSPAFTVPKGRGDVLGLDIFFDNNTITVLDELKLTVSANGINVLDGVSALQFAATYNTNRKLIPTPIPEGAQIVISAVNANATAVIIAVNLYFVKY